MTQFIQNNLFFVILAVVDIALFAYVFLLRRKVRIFLKGTKVMDVEDVVAQQTKIIKEIKGDFKKLSDWNAELQKISDISITKVGVIRFNPFKDTGGDQSFAIALLDSNNNGMVLSSLYTREGTRIYAKPIQNADSTYNLSDEEKEAIEKAINE